METTALVQGALEQLGTIGIATFAIYMLIQVLQDKAATLERWRIAAEQYAATERADKLLLLNVLTEDAKMQSAANAKSDAVQVALTRQEGLINELRAAKSA